MLRFITSRLVHSVIVLTALLVLVFGITHLTGDPAALALGADSTEQEVSQFRRDMGFDRPLVVQFADFARGVILHGEFGESLRYKEPALPIVLERLPATIELTFAAMLLALLIGVPTGLFAALLRGRAFDTALRMVSLVGQSAPVFWIGIVLIQLFAVQLQWLPSSGRDDGLASYVLPALALSTYSAASITRLLRASVLDTLTQDYVRTAHAKGVPQVVVILRHVLRNSLLPVVTLLGLQFGTLLGGAVITETIFSWPGLGRLVVQAIYNRDIFLIQAAVFTIAVLFVIINFATDVLYTALDPRVRLR